MVRRRMLALQEEKAEQAVLVLVHAQIVVATTGVRVEVVVLLELGDPRLDMDDSMDADSVGDTEIVVHADDAYHWILILMMLIRLIRMMMMIMQHGILIFMMMLIWMMMMMMMMMMIRR